MGEIPNAPMFSGIKILHWGKNHIQSHPRVCVNKQQLSLPLGLAPIQWLPYIARRSRWRLCTISNFRLHVIFRAALDSSQRSVGASWHTPSGRNTESARFGPVLLLRWWWGKCCTIYFYFLFFFLLCATSNGLLTGDCELRICQWHPGSKLSLLSCALTKCSNTEESSEL